MTSIALINTRAPYGCGHGQESLDLALAAGSFGQEVALFFVDDGVFQLLNKQAPENIEHKNYSKTFAALEFYDVENIYVCQKSLLVRGLGPGDLCIESEHLNEQELLSTLNKYKNKVRF